MSLAASQAALLKFTSTPAAQGHIGQTVPVKAVLCHNIDPRPGHLTWAPFAGQALRLKVRWGTLRGEEEFPAVTDGSGVATFHVPIPAKLNGHPITPGIKAITVYYDAGAYNDLAHNSLLVLK